MKQHSRGFTVIEIIFVILVLSISSIIFFAQKHSLKVTAADNSEKTAINSMYYSLEEVYYPTNGYYPQSISSDVLKSVDPDLFTDPNGVKMGSSGSLYTYKPTNCDDNKCKSYTLKADLAKEADYTKTSKHN